MKTLVIDRRRWLRGKKMSKHGSYLKRPSDGKMCCLGFYLNQCGVTQKNLSGNLSPSDFHDVNEVPDQAKWLLGSQYRQIDKKWNYIMGQVNSKDSTALMKYNDASGREDLIKKIFAKHNIEVKFIN